MQIPLAIACTAASALLALQCAKRLSAHQAITRRLGKPLSAAELRNACSAQVLVARSPSLGSEETRGHSFLGKPLKRGRG